MMGISGKKSALTGALAIIAGLTLAAWAQTGHTGAAGVAVFSISPPSQNASAGGPDISVDVKISAATNVAAWGFRVRYNPSILTYVSAVPDPSFLEGVAPPFCPNSIVDETAGTVTVGCVTAGQHAGADGSGHLGTLTFTPKAGGTSPLVFLSADVTDSYTNTLASDVSEGIVTVLGAGDSGGSGGGGGALAATPTRNPTLMTPTAIPGALPDERPTLGPNTGVPAGNSAGPSGGAAGATSNGSRPPTGVLALPPGQSQNSSTGGNASQSNDGFPVAGYGPQPAPAPRWPLYAAALVALTGVGMLGTGLRARRRAGQTT